MRILLLQRRSNRLDQRIQTPHHHLLMLNLLPIIINPHAAATIAQLLRRAVETDLVFLGGVFAIKLISSIFCS